METEILLQIVDVVNAVLETAESYRGQLGFQSAIVVSWNKVVEGSGIDPLVQREAVKILQNLMLEP